MKAILSDDQIGFYRDKGYLLVEKFISEDLILLAIQSINEILECNDMNSVAELEPRDTAIVRRIWAPTQKHPFFEKLAFDKMLLDAIACLIGENIVFHYSKINMKGPFVGSPVAWHQDFSYNPHTNTDLLTCLIYLDDANLQNACLQVIPGSHKNGLYSHYNGDYFVGKVAEENIPSISTVTPLEAPAGSVIFLHCLTLHKSSTNNSENPRRTFLPSYRAADSYPIYVGPHTGDHEPTTKLIRGCKSHFARVESATWALPFAEQEFNSLYEIQEGSHLKNTGRKKSGYFGHILKGSEQ